METAPPVEEQSVDRAATKDNDFEPDSDSLHKLQRRGLSLAAAASGTGCLVTVVLVVCVLCWSAASLALLIYVLQETLGNLGAP